MPPSSMSRESRQIEYINRRLTIGSGEKEGDDTRERTMEWRCGARKVKSCSQFTSLITA